MAFPGILSRPETAAYEKIRSFVVGQVAKAGNSPMRLASYRQLARQFGVTQTTVMKALKDLIADGYLTIKPGIGAFTNPVRLCNAEKVRLIGCFAGDGKSVFFGRYYWQSMSVFADAILRLSGSYQLQNCFLDSSKASAKDILKLGIDGLIWFEPSLETRPVLRELKESYGMPCLSVGRLCPGVSSFSFGNEPLFAAADRMLAEGRRRIMPLCPPKELAADIDAEGAVARAYARHGLKYDRKWTVYGSEEELRVFPEKLESVKPDGIISCYWGLLPNWPAIKAKLDIVEGCRLFCGETSLHGDMEYVGWVSRLDLKGDALLAASNFAEQFDSPERAGTLSRHFTMTPIIALDERKG